MRSRLLALLLVLSILPVTGEILELVVHWGQHGDVAHADSDEHDSAPLGSDEHGCSGLFHMCACHTAQATTPQESSSTTLVTTKRRVDITAPPRHVGCDAPAPTIRPPIV